MKYTVRDTEIQKDEYVTSQHVKGEPSTQKDKNKREQLNHFLNGKNIKNKKEKIGRTIEPFLEWEEHLEQTNKKERNKQAFKSGTSERKVERIVETKETTKNES